MIVVADTSPLNYLIQIDCDHLLPELYGRIVVPLGVMRELGNPAAPVAVREWLLKPPSWLDVIALVSVPDAKLKHLGLGEREAIQISGAMNADLLLVDDRKGRIEAIRSGLKTTGTLGVLLTARQMIVFDSESAYRRLVAETSFRTSPGLETDFIASLRSML